MSEPARHLHVVDAETGEKLDGCPHCQRKDDELAGLETVIRGQGAKIRELTRDKAKEAAAHNLWPEGLAWFRYWQRACGHEKAQWDHESFWLILPFLKNKVYRPWVKAAIDGAAFDPATKVNKNGRTERFDDFELVFRNRGKFESFVRRANHAVRDELPEEVAHLRRVPKVEM